jgi:NAD(P)-dependent dehydrogenase (short-subunit alcohol dehydrogenase family)
MRTVIWNPFDSGSATLSGSIGRRSQPQLQLWRFFPSPLRRRAVRLLPFQGDLTEVKNVTKLFDETVSRYGRLDIAVNTVGKVLKKPFIETTEAEYDSMFAINAKTAYFFMREAGKRMNEGGKIVPIVKFLVTGGWWITGQTIFANGGYTTR